MEYLMFIIHIHTGFFKTVPHLLIFTQTHLIIIKLSEEEYRKMTDRSDGLSAKCEDFLKKSVKEISGRSDLPRDSVYVAIDCVRSANFICSGNVYNVRPGSTMIEIKTMVDSYCGNIDKAFDVFAIAKRLKGILGDKAG